MRLIIQQLLKTRDPNQQLLWYKNLLVPFEGQEVGRLNEHLKRDMSRKYAYDNSLYSGSPKWKTDLESFEVWYVAEFCMELMDNEDIYLNISAILMHSLKILPYTKHGKLTREFNGKQNYESISI